MAAGPYRTSPTPEPGPPASALPRETLAVTVFVWLVTLLRVAASFGRAEPWSRELAFAWVVLVVAPYLFLRQIERR